MISLATGVIIGLSGVAGSCATLLTNDAIVKYNRDTDTIEKRAAKMGEKLTKNVNKRREKLESERERFKSENPGIVDHNDDSLTKEFIEGGLYYEEETNKLIRKMKVKNAIAETVIPTVVGGLVTAGMVAVCSAIADTAADDSDEDVDEE